jgi:hypothetical protein
MSTEPRESEQQRELREDLEANPPLGDEIVFRVHLLPPAPLQARRVIRTSIKNVDVAICRAMARAVEWREAWTIEIVTVAPHLLAKVDEPCS